MGASLTLAEIDLHSTGLLDLLRNRWLRAIFSTSAIPSRQGKGVGVGKFDKSRDPQAFRMLRSYSLSFSILGCGLHATDSNLALYMKIFHVLFFLLFLQD